MSIVKHHHNWIAGKLLVASQRLQILILAALHVQRWILKLLGVLLQVLGAFVGELHLWIDWACNCDDELWHLKSVLPLLRINLLCYPAELSPHDSTLRKGKDAVKGPVSFQK